MNEGRRQSIMAESNNLTNSQRRRSPRFVSPPSNNKMASALVKRSITVKKILPKKRGALSEHNKENTPRQSEGSQQKQLKVSTPDHGLSSPGKKMKKAAIASPILPPQQPTVDAEDAAWSQKVRRSYSRLSDKSLNSPDSRETLFGFEKLQTPDVCRLIKTAPDVSSSLSGLNSFTSLLEAADDGPCAPVLDTNIPGVSVVKEKRRRRKKVQKINNTELEALAATMNAEFEEAEKFGLTVE